MSVASLRRLFALPACLQFGAFMREVDLFDAAAYGLSTAEAAAMDPQHR